MKYSYITFIFSDIEGSTRLWEEYDRDMEVVMAQHDKIVHGAVTEFGGRVFKHTGDGMAAAFSDVCAAARAALQAQQRLLAADWGAIRELRSRMGIHRGRAQRRAGEYFGRDVNRCARIMDAAHGGQVLVSHPAAELLGQFDSDGWLLRDLGEHQLKDLSQPEQVFQLTLAALPSRFPELRSVDRVPRQLPAIAELFVGRKVEIHKLGDLLRKGRLITLTGPGGVGKTQLALAAALDHIREFPDGVWFCPLAAKMSTDQIAEMIESTMGLQVTGEAGAMERLAVGLGTRRTLIILDGAERALAECRALLSPLIYSCHNVTILCTSREVLHEQHEQVLPVRPLLLPELDADDVNAARKIASVELFEKRAQLADSAFQLNSDNLSAVISICHQLDGLPLAVELAAAQMAAQDPQDLAVRIGSRVALIDDGNHTLSTIVEWSYHSLSDQERKLFERLAVFSGGFSLTLAERVCAGSELSIDDIMPGLRDLVSKSVISIQRTADGNRYVMLELLRRFAMRQVTSAVESDEVRQRHLDAYIEFAGSAQEGLETDSEADWVKRVSTEFANLRTAFAWALESGQTDRALELIHYTDSFARERFRREIDSWAEEALQAANGDEDYLFAAQSVMASAAARRGDIASAIHLADQAVESGQRSSVDDIFMTYRLTAITGILSGDEERAIRATDSAIELATRLQRTVEIARFKSMQAHTAVLSAESDKAIDLANSALDQARGVGNPSLLAWCLFVAGSIEPDETRALALFEEAIEFADMVSNRYVAGIALQMASWKRRSASDEEIAAGFSRVITHWYRVANLANLALSLAMFIQSAHDFDNELVAVIDGWLGHAAATSSAFSVEPNEAYKSAIARIRERVGDDAFRAAANRGATMDTTQIVHYCKLALDADRTKAIGL